MFELVYDELRSMAKRRISRLAPGQTLQATALVHEVWLKIADPDKAWAGRAEFFRVVARAMRNILVDGARRKSSKKHGGGYNHVSTASIVSPEREATALEFLALDEALVDLERLDPRAAKIVMLRYFGGLELVDVAGMLEVSERTVERDWRFARSWLHDRMAESGGATLDAPGQPESERPHP